MSKLILAGAISLGLAGCGLAARIDARGDYQSSVAAYKACLAERAPQTCEGLRLAMEADERKYNNLSAGMHPGDTRSNTVTILNR